MDYITLHVWNNFLANDAVMFIGLAIAVTAFFTGGLLHKVNIAIVGVILGFTLMGVSCFAGIERMASSNTSVTAVASKFGLTVNDEGTWLTSFDGTGYRISDCYTTQRKHGDLIDVRLFCKPDANQNYSAIKPVTK